MDVKIIKLSKEDTELFEHFKKYKNDFKILLEHGVFSFKNGRAIVSRDNDGTIRKVEVYHITYRS